MSQSDHLIEAELRRRLAEAEAALAALRSGKADTLIGDAGPLLFQLKSAVEAQKQAEAALRESEERNRFINELISDYAYAFRVEADGTMRGEWVSDSFTRVFGFTVPEMEARGGWQIVVFPEDLSVALAHARKVVGGEKDVCEMRFVTRAGEPRWLRDYAVPVWDATQGRVVRIYGAAQDITERKQAEAALRESEARLAFLMQATPAVIYTSKPFGDYGATFVTENITRQTGYSPREFVEDSGFWASHIHPDDRARVFAELPRLFEQGYHVHEYRFQHRDGHYLWMRDELRLIRDADGNPQEIIGFWLDITERKQAEEALRESEARFRRLFENSLVGIYRTTPDGRILLANPTLVKMLRYPSFEALAQQNLEKDGFPAESSAPPLQGSHRAGRRGSRLGKRLDLRRRHDHLCAGERASGARAGCAHRVLRRGGGRHHRTAAAGGIVAPSAENGGHRPVGRWGGA
jgi:PAS domain S-box-containing protein